MNNNREIWVFIETDNSKIVKSSLELFTPAKEIAMQTGGSVTAVILGGDIAKTAAELGHYGADRVIAVSAGEYSAEKYTETMASLIEKYQPDALMFSATSNAKDFVSKLAARVKTGVTANCTQLSVDPESGLISWMMPAPGGIIATILCRKTRPQMGTICPGIFKKPIPDENRTAPIITEQVPSCEKDMVRRVAHEIIKREKSIEDAEIIVAGGFGVGKEGFELLEKFANELGGVVAASRAAVDAGWISEERMVGQSGKVVHPKLYFAVGISGALQHVVGIDSDCIVAVNTDKNAPIFELADYGIIGSAEKVIPELIEEIKAAKI